MSDRLQEYIDNISLKAALWRRNVGTPYIRAYDRAYDNYQKALKEQSERDKAEAELLVLAASVLTGSVMMAAFATTSLRTVAGRALLHVICERNLDRTFNALHAVSNNKVAMFAIGAILDEAGSRVTKQVQDAANDLMVRNSVATSPTALNYMTRIQDFMDSNEICARTVANAVRASALSEAEKHRMVARLEAAPFYNPPASARIDEVRLSEKMELSMYMVAILDSDTLVKTEGHSSMGQFPAMPRMTEQPIQKSPSARDYPQATMPQYSYGYVGPYQHVGITELGSGLRRKVDELYGRTIGGRFYQDRGLFNGGPSTTHTELVKAETTLDRLGDIMRPATMTDVRT